MTRKNSAGREGNGADNDTERGLFARLVEGIIVFFICALLLRLGIEYLLCIRIPLLVIAVIAAVIIITYRVYRWKRHHDDY